MTPIRKMWETTRPARPAASLPSASQGGGFKRFLPVIILSILLLAAIGTSAYFYSQLQAARKAPAPVPATTAKNDQETADLVAAVGKLMVLPTDETPTIATVSDPAKLADQAFFAHAKVGDKVLIYAQSKKAVLYSPSENRIVEVAAINLTGTPTAPATK